MKRKAIIALIVVAALISLSAVSYFTYFSPPFNTQWKTNIGYSGINAGGIASGAGDFFLLSTTVVETSSFNYTSTSYVLDAFNSTTGTLEWKLPLQVTLPGQNFLLTVAPSENPAGDMPQIHFWNNSLYLGSYVQNFTIGSHTANYSSGPGFLLADISPANGAVHTPTRFNLTGIVNNMNDWSFGWYGSGVYLTYKTVQKSNITDNATAIDLGNFQTAWVSSFQFPGNSGPATCLQVYPSGSYVALFGNVNGTGILYSLSRYTGTVEANYGLKGISSVTGVSGNSFILGRPVDGKLVIYLANLSHPGISNITTSIPYRFLSTPTLWAGSGQILVSLNSTVYAYSTSGAGMWTDSMQYANVNNYVSGFIESGHGSLLYWSEVSVFHGSNGGTNYRVTYNHFAQLNSTNGDVSWQRSYTPASSFLMNERGSVYTPLLVVNGVLLYQSISLGGTVIAVADL